jgi:hypothetical protein
MATVGRMPNKDTEYDTSSLFGVWGLGSYSYLVFIPFSQGVKQIDEVLTSTQGMR